MYDKRGSYSAHLAQLVMRVKMGKEPAGLHRPGLEGVQSMNPQSLPANRGRPARVEWCEPASLQSDRYPQP